MPMLAFLQNIGFTELIVILLIALLLFGGRLPEVGRNLGRGISQFKKGLREMEQEIQADDKKPDDTAKKADDTTKKPS